ncbi:MAG TPA: hypothetical protein VIR57_13295, partial [Chloroflexota bacterium]
MRAGRAELQPRQRAYPNVPLSPDGVSLISPWAVGISTGSRCTTGVLPYVSGCTDSTVRNSSAMELAP